MTVLLANKLTPPTGELKIVGEQAAKIAGPLVLTGYAPIVVVGTVITPGAGALAFTENAPTVQTTGGTNLTPAAGALVLTGVAPTLQTTGHVTLTPSAGALTLTGLAPIVLTGATLTPAQAALVLSGAAPVLITDSRLTPAQGALALTGQTPSAPVGTIKTPSQGALTLTGSAAVVTTGTYLTPSVGALTLAGLSPGIQAVVDISIRPATGLLTATGQQPTVVGGLKNLGPITSRRIPTPRTWKKIELRPSSVAVKAPEPEQQVIPHEFPRPLVLEPVPVATAPNGDLLPLQYVGRLAGVNVSLTPGAGTLAMASTAPELIFGKEGEEQARRWLEKLIADEQMAFLRDELVPA